jgi:radical SAM protein with 4Fe4S-binding SPASM domain|tara:strand:- start:1576 stop:2346 length:771 start_codon:yes stop_codon:yes gene_type:complete
VSDPDVYTNKREGIELTHYEKILMDLRDISFDGTILWSMFSEPLLHKGINDLAIITKKILPAVRLQIVSNGDMIRKHNHKLMELLSNGVDQVQFSLYDDAAQYQEFIAIRDRLGFTEEQMMLRRRYFENGNFNLTISNRAGLVDSNEFRSLDEQKVERETLPLKKRCFYPFYQIAIDYNGDVLLCPHDWSKDLILGNAVSEHIWDIWTGEKVNNVRSSLAVSNRDLDPCTKCDVDGELIGEEHFVGFTARVDESSD